MNLSLTSSQSRWLLLGSLALNLFFIGVGIALLVRGPGPGGDRSMASRIERLAENLPSADADTLRSQFKANATTVETARANYRAAQDTVRETLRREPFDADAMAAAMAQTRAARQNFDQALQSVVASAVTQMTPAGRKKLGEERRN